jgi:hypothetical protein
MVLPSVSRQWLAPLRMAVAETLGQKWTDAVELVEVVEMVEPPVRPQGAVLPEVEPRLAPALPTEAGRE